MSFNNYRKIIINSGNDFTLYFSGSGAPFTKLFPALGGSFDARINQSDIDTGSRGLIVTDSGSVTVDLENIRGYTTLKLETPAAGGPYPTESYQVVYTEGDKILTGIKLDTGNTVQISPTTTRIQISPFNTAVKLPVRAKDISTDDLVIRNVVSIEAGGDTGSLSKRINAFDDEGNIASPILFRPGGSLSDIDNFSIASGSGIELIAGTGKEQGKTIDWVSGSGDVLSEIYTFSSLQDSSYLVLNNFPQPIGAPFGAPLPDDSLVQINLQIYDQTRLSIRGSEIYSSVTGSFPYLNLRNLPQHSSEATALVINDSNVVGTRELGSNAFNSNSYLRSDQSGTLTGNLTVTGKITAEEFHTEFVSASIIYRSGSTQFGDTTDDTHSFTGTVNIEGSGSTVFSVDGSSGRLFSVTDDLSDSLFSANTIAGLPVLEVFSDNTVKIGTFNDEAILVNGNTASITGSLEGTSSYSDNSDLLDGLNSTQFLRSDESDTMTGDLTVDGNLTVNGNTTLGNAGSDTLRIYSSDVELNKASAGTNHTIKNTNAASDLILETTSDIILSPTNNVGIGTSTPSEKLTISGSISSSGDVYIDGGIYDNNETLGTPDQVLFTTSTGIEWRDNIAQQAQDLVITGKNLSGGTIAKGTPLYFTGSGTSGNTVGIYPADAGNPDRMPAGGVAGESIADEVEGDVYIYGFINGVDTSAFNAGDDVFVAVGGGYTNQKPTGSALIQKLGNVEKVDPTNGSGVIQGPSWYNDLPNWEGGKVKVGRDDGQPVTSSVIHLDETNGRMGVGTVSPTNKLHIYSNSTQVSPDSHIPAGATLHIQDSSNSLYLDGNSIIGTGDGTLHIGNQSNTPMNLWTNGLNRLHITADGNVGIGTTSPSAKLHTTGVGYFSGGTISFTDTVTNAGIVIDEEDYIYTKDNLNLRKLIGKSLDVIHIGQSGTSLIDEIRLLPGNSGIVTVYDNTAEVARFTGGNVGIGTTSPSNTLHVFKDATIGAITSTNVANAGLHIQDAGANMYMDGNSIVTDNSGYLTTNGAYYFQIGTNNTPRIHVDSDGNVGIGTTSVTGKFNSYISATRQLTHNGNGGDLSIISDNNSNPVMYIKGTGTADLLNVVDNTTEVFTILDGGNVGIGTTSPTAKLHIEGGTGLSSLSVNDTFLIVGDVDSLNLAIDDNEIQVRNNGLESALLLQKNGGNVGIGTTSPPQPLTVAGNISGSGNLDIDGDGYVDGTLTAGRVVETSTRELKENIQPLETQKEVIDSLQPVSYSWKEGGEKDFGLIAEDVAEIAPDLVSYDEEGKLKGIKYSKLSVLLLDVVKKQNSVIEELSERITKLETNGGK